MKKITSFIARHPLFFLFVLALLFRFFLFFIDYSWDVNNHIVWAKDLTQRGFANFYIIPSSEVYATVYPNYPPLSLFIFYLIYPLQSIIYNLLWWLNVTFPLFPSKLIFFVQSRAFLAGLLKIPSVIADLGIAWICYVLVKQIAPTKNKLHFIIVSLILFNPAIFYNSAFWGQIDAIPLFFILASLYFLLFSKKSLVSGMCFTLALLVKPTTLVFAPIYIIYFVLNNRKETIIQAFVLVNTIFWFSFLPFIGKGARFFSPYILYVDKILTKQSLPYVTNGAFNFWILITYFTGIKDTATFMAGLSYRIWGYALAGNFLLLIIYYLLKKKRDKTYQIFFALTLSALAVFLFLTKMHERYLILPLPFLLLASVRDKKLMWTYVYFSLSSFLNLYHSWPVPNSDILKLIVNNPVVVIALSGLNVFLFFYLLFFRFNKYNV